MKYLQTKHERNSAKITTLIMLILMLLLFVVGQDYKEQPEEYGVAINFASSSIGEAKVQPEKSEDVEELVEEDLIEEETEAEEVIEEERIEEEIAEEKAIEEIEEAKKEAEEAKEILREEAEEAENVKKEKAAKEKAETEAKEEEAKKAQEAKEKADSEAKALAKERAATEAKEKAESEAKALAKAKAEAKAKADSEAKAAAAKKAKEGIPFALLENKPIYPGCESVDNNEREKCMSEKIKNFIMQNFDTDLAADLIGIQKINISFKINTAGNVVSISAKASDPKLEAEAKRVTSLLPRMKPGMQQGTPVVVAYGLPIRIKMED